MNSANLSPKDLVPRICSSLRVENIFIRAAQLVAQRFVDFGIAIDANVSKHQSSIAGALVWLVLQLRADGPRVVKLADAAAADPDAREPWGDERQPGDIDWDRSSTKRQARGAARSALGEVCRSLLLGATPPSRPHFHPMLDGPLSFSPSPFLCGCASKHVCAYLHLSGHGYPVHSFFRCTAQVPSHGSRRWRRRPGWLRRATATRNTAPRCSLRVSCGFCLWEACGWLTRHWPSVFSPTAGNSVHASPSFP